MNLSSSRPTLRFSRGAHDRTRRRRLQALVSAALGCQYGVCSQTHDERTRLADRLVELEQADRVFQQELLTNEIATRERMPFATIAAR